MKMFEKRVHFGSRFPNINGKGMNGMPRYSDYVDPYIGTIGHLLTATKPLVHLPHSMAQIQPTLDERIRDNYVAPEIFGFPLFALTVMADVEGNKTFRSLRDHDFDEVRCYKGSVLLTESDIRVEYTVTERCALYRFTFPKGNGKALLRFVPDEGGTIRCKGSAICGTAVKREAPYAAHVTISQEPICVEERENEILCTFPEGSTLVVKAGFSHIDADQARVNLEKEAQNLSFDEAAEKAQQIWDDALGRIEVKGGTEKQKRIFYTSLYRVYQRMININEYGRYYSGYDKKVHTDDRDFYVNDGIWDTYRTAHPLQLILEPERQSDIVDSYLRMYMQCGYIPTFPYEGGNVPCMIGKHSTALIADSYLKGLRGFDTETAWEGIIKNEEEMTKLPWRIDRINEFDECYFESGFFPALPEGAEEWLPAHPFERRQCVAVTLETAYDAFCISEFGKALGTGLAEIREAFPKLPDAFQQGNRLHVAQDGGRRMGAEL
jgi:putative alpha-1,2-mannosidase